MLLEVLSKACFYLLSCPSLGWHEYILSSTASKGSSMNNVVQHNFCDIYYLKKLAGVFAGHFSMVFSRTIKSFESTGCP